MAKKVTLGEGANIFHDMTTGVTIVKGESIELSTAQLQSKKIKAALAGGHLAILVTEEKVEKGAKVTKKSNKEVKAEIVKLSEEGKTEKKIADKFTMGELKDLAIDLELVPEESDTKETLVKAILEEIEE